MVNRNGMMRGGDGDYSQNYNYTPNTYEPEPKDLNNYYSLITTILIPNAKHSIERNNDTRATVAVDELTTATAYIPYKHDQTARDYDTTQENKKIKMKDSYLKWNPIYGTSYATIHNADLDRDIGDASWVGAGGAPRRRKPTVGRKESPQWVSTGRQTTLKDGIKRTVYRNSKTGERATKRLTERNGKRTAKYVKL